MRRPRGRARRDHPITALGDRLLAITASAGAATVLASVHLIGSPPRMRIDQLWVHWNRRMVELAFFGLAICLATILLGLFRGRGWFMPVLLTAIAITCCLTIFSDRVPIVLRTVAGHFSP